MRDIRFKPIGTHKLFSFDELMRAPLKVKQRKIMVIDPRSQRNYKTGFMTIVRKFK